jgi:hypothetical protein
MTLTVEAQLNPEDLDDALYIDGHPEEFMEGDRIRARATIDCAEEELAV